MSFRLDPDLKDKLRTLAEADKRSLTNYIEVVLERHVADMRGERKVHHALDDPWIEARKPR